MPKLNFDLEKVFEFRLVDKADGTHSVEGIATSEKVDHDGEIADYKDTLEEIKTWSGRAQKVTSNSGQEVSLGNIRVQHDPKYLGGKVTAMILKMDRRLSRSLRSHSIPCTANLSFLAWLRASQLPAPISIESVTSAGSRLLAAAPTARTARRTWLSGSLQSFRKSAMSITPVTTTPGLRM